MKIRLSLFCLALAIFASHKAEAQLAYGFGDPYCEPSACQPVTGEVYGGPVGGGVAGPGGRLSGLASGAAGRPGRFWIQSNTADQGLGYEGSYLTVGAKNRLFEDRFDGRWLIEGEVHHSIEDDGGFFSNIGIERVFTVDAANADVSLSAWYDYDGDANSGFGHDFHQIGASAQIKTPKWDLIGNGYFPVGIQDYSFGDPAGLNCFVGNSIVMIPGIDSALEGFDVTWRARPSQLAIVNGTIDIGGYHYSSELVQSFGGGRVRFGFQAFRGMIVSAEVNHDDRFETTGVLSVGWLFGANGSGFGHEYSHLGRDLESVVRNDHIVRFNRDPELAIDPITGMPYNVVHVNNLADPGFEEGTAERPFVALQTAQANSAPGDVIAVNSGDGTDRNYQNGIQLQDNQRLYGTGSQFLIPVQNGQFFNLCADGSGVAPTISNAGGFTVVGLANNNDVAGVNINAAGARFGIFGIGDNNGMIRNNTIANADEDGVRIVNPTGNYTFRNNLVQNNLRDGIFIRNALDTTSVFDFTDNRVNNNAFDGIHLFNYDPASIVFRRNTTNNNLRHGLLLQNYLNSSGNPLLIQGHVASNNVGRGIFINGGDGNLRIFNSTVTNNSGSGLTIRNWTNSIPTDNIIVGTVNSGSSTFSGNGAVANIEFLLNAPGVRSNVIVTNNSINNGVSGVVGRAEGLNTVLNIDIRDNVGINGNINDGIRLLALNSATVNTRIGSSNPSLLENFIDNAAGDGTAINLIAQGANGQPAARMNALVENVLIDNVTSPIQGRPGLLAPTTGVGIQSLNNAVADVTVRNANIGPSNFTNNRTTQLGVVANIDNDGSQLINRIFLEDLTTFSEFGVTLNTGTETYTDFTLLSSTLNPNGPQSVPGVRADNTPFTASINGDTGIFITASGQGMFTGQFNQIQPITPGEMSFLETVSDGVIDNLTRVRIEDNLIRDYAFDGVDIATFGDASLALTFHNNQVLNNGAGLNNDADNDNAFNDQAVSAVEDPNNLFFFDGVNIDAFDQSTISTRITNNLFRDNFERGLSLNTFNAATINAVVNNNTFFGNDRGEDVDNTLPPIGVGTATPAPAPVVIDAGNFDFEAVNNEEFYFRDYESLIFINAATGAPQTLGGVALPANSLGVFYPGNSPTDIFGNAVAIGTARLNLSMSTNAFQLGVDLLDFSLPPGDFTLGLDGATNGFTGPVPGITPVGPTFAELLVGNEEAFFGAQGFPAPAH